MNTRMPSSPLCTEGLGEGQAKIHFVMNDLNLDPDNIIDARTTLCGP